MKYLAKVAICIIFICALNCSENLNGISETASRTVDPNYPTTLTPLTALHLQMLQDRFSEINGADFCASLNEYGFVEGRFIGCSDPPHTDSLVSEEKAIELATNWLVENNQFTNIDSTDSLDLIRVVNLEDRHWRLTFGNQNSNGLEVPNTTFVIQIQQEVFNITSHHYPDALIPEYFQVSAEEARESVLGDSILCFPNHIPISEATTSGEITRGIYPLKENDSIELRVCHKIPVILIPGDSPSFYVYVDVVSGEKLWTEPRVVCF